MTDHDRRNLEQLAVLQDHLRTRPQPTRAPLPEPGTCLDCGREGVTHLICDDCQEARR